MRLHLAYGGSLQAPYPLFTENPRRDEFIGETPRHPLVSVFPIAKASHFYLEYVAALVNSRHCRSKLNMHRYRGIRAQMGIGQGSEMKPQPQGSPASVGVLPFS